ncbi:YbaN family protein [Shewanella sp. YIC-542]|uniref:YbaN family protein n=1 Tax=Shewanella mytili TaxID=3377111 RepID=UPI00398F4447
MIKRGLLSVAGILSLLLGILGMALPVLPTVPFVLLAGFCFARSSPALHNWLLRHPWFAQSLSDWQRQRAMRSALKRRALLLSVCSFSLSLWWVSSYWVKGVLFLIFMILIVFLWRIPVVDPSRKTLADDGE